MNKSQEDEIYSDKKPKFNLFLQNKSKIFQKSTQNRKKKQEQLKKEEEFLEAKSRAIIKLRTKIEELSEIQKLQKSVRHFHDSLNYFSIRNDIETNDSKFFHFCYELQTSFLWVSFLKLLAWIFLLLTFLEPANAKDITLDRKSSTFISLFSSETFFLIVFLWDLIMEIVHRKSNDTKTFTQNYVKNFKFLSKFLSILFFTLDYLIFYSTYPEYKIIRFSRFFRPIYIISISREIKRTFKGILFSVRRFLDLIIFLYIVIGIWAAIGMKIIGNYDGKYKYDEYYSNFNNFGRASYDIYALGRLDGYPIVMEPSLESSYYNLIYFLPYVVSFILLLEPIPVAIIFDSFRLQRSNLLLLDRIKQREALIGAFLSLDFEKKRKIPKTRAFQMMNFVYKLRVDKLKIEKLLTEVIEGKNEDENTINMDDFFKIMELVQQNSQYAIPLIADWKPWIKLKKFCNKRLYFNKIVNNFLFELFMMLINLLSCILVVLDLSDLESESMKDLKSVESILAFIYLAEALLKIIGLGIINYFKDDGNKFDFAIMLITLFSDFFLSLFSFMKSAKAIRMTRLIKISKMQRLLRILKSVKKVRFCHIIFVGIESLGRVKAILIKIFHCIPIVLKLIPLLLLTIYFYSIIGMESLSTVYNKPKHSDSPYSSYFNYANFNSFGGSLLVLFQVCTESGVSNIFFDYSYKFDSFGSVMLFFLSFHTIAVFMLISLMVGLIWEVFNIFYEEEQKNEGKDEEERKKSKKEDNRVIFNEYEDTFNEILLIEYSKKNIFCNDKDSSSSNSSSHSSNSLSKGTINETSKEFSRENTNSCDWKSEEYDESKQNIEKMLEINAHSDENNLHSSISKFEKYSHFNVKSNNFMHINGKSEETQDMTPQITNEDLIEANIHKNEGLIKLEKVNCISLSEIEEVEEKKTLQTNNIFKKSKHKKSKLEEKKEFKKLSETGKSPKNKNVFSPNNRKSESKKSVKSQKRSEDFSRPSPKQRLATIITERFTTPKSKKHFK